MSSQAQRFRAGPVLVVDASGPAGDTCAMTSTSKRPAGAAELPLLSPGPSAGYDEPMEMLAACHARAGQRVDLLERLGEHLAARPGVDAPAREAASDLLRYFDLAAPLHHEDEERHVLPRLVREGRMLLAEQIKADHASFGESWGAIREDLARLVAQGDDLNEGLAARRERWHAFAQAYRAHIALEEAEAFPAVDASLDDEARLHMGVEMARRRGVRKG
jgi:hemerythrin-like domain-containing protein